MNGTVKTVTKNATTGAKIKFCIKMLKIISVNRQAIQVTKSGSN
jgi:hypothetical protein